MRAFVDFVGRDHAPSLWRSAGPVERCFRYGVQVDLLALDRAQSENNAYRILIEMLSVVLSKDRLRPRRARVGLGTRRSACPGRSTRTGR